jgi:hypothetical protein
VAALHTDEDVQPAVVLFAHVAMFFVPVVRSPQFIERRGSKPEISGSAEGVY